VWQAAGLLACRLPGAPGQKRGWGAFPFGEAFLYEHLELLFPSRVISALRDLRGERWQALVDEAQRSPATSVAHLGFGLMMSRLARCNTCSIDSQRAIRGCAVCGRKAVTRFKGDDDELLHLYLQACEEVDAFLRRTRSDAEALPKGAAVPPQPLAAGAGRVSQA